MTSLLAWSALILAGFAEVGWVYFLKQSDGFSKIFPAIFCSIFLILSMALLAFSIKVIPISLAYPIWTGIGAAGAVIIGVLFFDEAINIYRTIFLAMIISGVIGLKLQS